MNISQSAEWLLSRDNFLILSHIRPDGDTLCSAAALCRGLRALGKRVYCLENPGITERYLPYLSPYHAPADFTPDHVLSVDTASRGMLQPNAGAWADRVELAIDHHMSHVPYAQDSCILPEKAACGEIIYDLLLALGYRLDGDCAGLLYIAVSTDTGCFKYSNVNAATFRCAAALLDAGAPHVRLNRIFHRAKSRARLALEGYILSHLESYREGKVILVTVPDTVLRQLGATENDTEDIASLAGQVDSSVVSVTLRDLAGGGAKISVRTSAGADANAICSLLGGGGHKAAAGCSLPGLSLEAAKARILEAVDQAYKG